MQSPQIVIVVGGLATRMRPLCEKIPKCLIDIQGKPLIERQIEIFKRQGFKNFVFCVAHLKEKVREYFGDGEKFGVSIKYADDGNTLLGTAGAVRAALNILDDVFMVYYGDTISQMNFRNLFEDHFKSRAEATLSLREKPKGYKSSSLILLDKSNEIQFFSEKPDIELISKYENTKTYINNGIFVLNKSLLEELVPIQTKFDFSKDLFSFLPKTSHKIRGYISNDFYREIGRMEKYEEIKKEILK